MQPKSHGAEKRGQILLDHNHLARRREIPRVEPVEIVTAGNRLALPITNFA